MLRGYCCAVASIPAAVSCIPAPWLWICLLHREPAVSHVCLTCPYKHDTRTLIFLRCETFQPGLLTLIAYTDQKEEQSASTAVRKPCSFGIITCRQFVGRSPYEVISDFFVFLLVSLLLFFFSFFSSFSTTALVFCLFVLFCFV